MTTQYLRKVSIAIGDGGGRGLDFADFRCVFSVRRGDIQTPNQADVRVYNLAPQTVNRITKKNMEFTQLVIQAGYEGNFGLIFRGQIKQTRYGREDAKDSYVDITAADGDEAYNWAVSSFSLAAGTKPADEVQQFLQTMLDSGISMGYMPELSSNGRVRGRVYFGRTRDELRDWSESNGVLWSIQDGKLTLIPKTNFIPGDVPIISPTSGMIGVPEQTQNGIQVRTLLNPLLKIGQKIQLQGTVNQLRLGTDRASLAVNAPLSQAVKLNADGFYYVMQADHSGDTRGNEYYTDLTCLAIDASIQSPQVGAELANKSSIFPGGPVQGG